MKQNIDVSDILLDYQEVINAEDIKRLARGKSILEPFYKMFVSSFYLKTYSAYRHMWE